MLQNTVSSNVFGRSLDNNMLAVHVLVKLLQAEEFQQIFQIFYKIYQKQQFMNVIIVVEIQQ